MVEKARQKVTGLSRAGHDLCLARAAVDLLYVRRVYRDAP
jgi:hypothetical protein